MLVIDQLGANQLSTYGNTVYQTDSLNELASRSLVFEQATVATIDPTQTYQQWFGKPWTDQLAEAGISSAFLSDAPQMLAHPVTEWFDQAVPLTFSKSESLAADPDQTELAEIFAQLVQWVESRPENSLTWVHLRGLGGTWDAPYSWRERLAAEDDPDPPRLLSAPQASFDQRQDDPDLLLGVQQAVAAQVRLLDHFLGALFYLLQSDQHANTMLCMTSTRGYPIGEHGWIGPSVQAAGWNESNHVPCLLQIPAAASPVAKQSAMVRCQQLFPLSMLTTPLSAHLLRDPTTLDHWIKPLIFESPDSESELVVMQDGSRRSIQTHQWKLIHNQHDDATWLYAKPDDLWEVNDVSRRCPEIVEQLTELMDERLNGL